MQELILLFNQIINNLKILEIMKKIIFVFSFMLAIVACTGNKSTNNEVKNDSTATDSVEFVDSTLIDTICMN